MTVLYQRHDLVLASCKDLLLDTTPVNINHESENWRHEGINASFLSFGRKIQRIYHGFAEKTLSVSQVGENIHFNEL